MQSRASWEFLVICADAHLRETLLAGIHQFGGSANWTADSIAALAYISRRKLDGIFIDMRVEGALKIVGSIRRGSSNRYCAIFACTSEDEDTTRVLNSGANFAVPKNVAADKLVNLMEGAVQMMLVERQRYSRYRLTVPVILKAAGSEQKAMTANISRGGMAVQCGHSLQPGHAINFVLDLPGELSIQGQGEVAWAKGDGHMGIRFYLLGSDTKHTLWKWIEEYASQYPA